MPSLFFTNTLMLTGMAALAIPILIHLLLKRRKKKLSFSTIRFFVQQDEQSSRRRKLRNWLLLAIRLLIVGLLVLAFSRPYSQQNQSAAAAHKQHRVVFVLDRSASMLAMGREGQRWSLAKQKVQKALSGLDSDDQVALIECSTHANVLAGFAPPASAVQVVRDLGPGYGTSTLSDGLKEAVRLLSNSAPDSGPTIYLVTDLQKSACRGLNNCPIPRSIDFQVLSVGDVAAPNLAIVKLDAGSHDESRPQVSIANFSDEDASSATLDLATETGSFSSKNFSLKAGAATNIDIALPGLKPGWHDIKAILRGRDSLEADNTRYGSLFVPEPARVLMVEPRSSSRVFEKATFFVSSALDPGKDSTNSVPGPFNLTEVSPDRLGGVLSTAKGQPWNVVLLGGVKELPTGIGKDLLTFVQGGGGLILFLDEGMSANRYNSELVDLLPAKIGNPEAAPDVNSPWRVAYYDTNSVVFAPFRSANSGDLRIPEFTKRFGLEVQQGAAKLSYFDDGVPLVVTRTVGPGRVALVNTSADTAWTDWPKHKTFVPFLHGLAKYVAQRTNSGADHDAASYLAGEDFEIELGTSARGQRFTFHAPDGKETNVIADVQGRVPDQGINGPGMYSLRDKTGHEVRRIAINVPSQESNLEALRPADFQQQLVRDQESPKQTLAAGLFGAHNDRRELWTALLLGALILLLVEPFVANRTSV